MNDQNAKADAGKPRLSLVPPQIMWEIAAVRGYGCNKYPNGGTENWRNVEMDRHFDAMVRHIFRAWYDHSKIDPESGLKHLSHAACDLAFILEQLEGERVEVEERKENKTGKSDQTADEAHKVHYGYYDC